MELGGPPNSKGAWDFDQFRPYMKTEGEGVTPPHRNRKEFLGPNRKTRNIFTKFKGQFFPKKFSPRPIQNS